MKMFNVYICVTVEAEDETDARYEARYGEIEDNDIMDVTELVERDGVLCEETGRG